MADYMVLLGLGRPINRAVFAAALATLVVFAVRPSCMFQEDGCLRKQALDRIQEDQEETHTYTHVALVPIVAGIAGYMFF